jgi:four helix bundle protein
MAHPNDPHPYFAHDRLDVYRAACDALVLGDPLCRRLPRGYAALADQLRRALLSSQLNIAEAASRSGADRVARFRTARGECSEAAAAAEAVGLLRLRPTEEITTLRAVLGRVYAMLTRLAPPR